jgi:orotate phosphoribosyltransferase
MNDGLPYQKPLRTWSKCRYGNNFSIDYSYIIHSLDKVDLIGGVATSGIPYATSIADKLKLPLVYSRSQLKSHGTKSGLEGDYNKGDKVIIVEDLISTGSSVLNAVDLTRV